MLYEVITVLRLDLAMSDILNAEPTRDAPQPNAANLLLTEVEVRDLERRNTQLALEMSGWRISGPNGAARLLGVKPTTLADRIRKFKLVKPAAGATG